MEGVSKFGSGATDSFVHPVAMVALFVTIIMILLLPRKHIIIAVLYFVFLIPQGQQFYIGGLHIYIYRIIVLVGLIRMMCSNGHDQEKNLAGGWNVIDTSVSLYVLIQAIVFSLQYQSLGAAINQVGYIWDYLGAYFLMRSLIVDHEDINGVLKCVGYIFALLAVTMLIEQRYFVNVFGYIGGQLAPEIREGSVRSCGSFRHPLTAGTAGATAIPLFLFLWHQDRQWFAVALGVISATIITFAAHSSGPLIAYAAGIIALLVWPKRRSMRLIRWAAAISLFIVHFVMKAPVWFLIARIDLTGSSSSYHRAILVDQFITHFWEWWLLGSPNHVKWGYDLWDVQNQYVSAGIEGGLGALICFIAIMIYGFSMIGNASKSIIGEQQERCLWALGATLFSYMIAFMGVNLFDQSRVLWIILLAIISTYTASLSTPRNSAHNKSNASGSEWCVN
jgi:hypothetical protein